MKFLICEAAGRGKQDCDEMPSKTCRVLTELHCCKNKSLGNGTYIPMFAIHNILPANKDVPKCIESLMKYQSLANNMFISEHVVYLSQAHDKEQQILEEAKQSCC